MKSTIQENLAHIRGRIQEACVKAHRNRDEVRLLLATKTVDAEKVQQVLDLGENLIGENKVQELKEKCPVYKNPLPEVHFIGHLQSNKIKEVIKWADCIESIDRLSLAEKLNNRLEFEQKKIDVFIQVNTSYEESKFGVAPEKAIDLIRSVSNLKNLNIKGLMTIGLFSAEPEKVRKCFQLLKKIQSEANALKIPGVSLNELSMGMSGDMEIAIEEGATIVRVGTAIFGKRRYPDSYYWNEGTFTPGVY